MCNKFIHWFSALQGGEYIDFAILIITIAGGLFALHQWQNANRLKRSEFVNHLTEKLRSDEEIIEMIYMLEYNSNWYNEEFHGNKDGLEAKIDKTLLYFSYICYLKKNRLLTKEDFGFFEYEVKRIADNYSIQSYFFNLYHFSKASNVKISFYYLFEYCYSNSLFDNETDIKSKNESSYPQYLNF